ncbi:uncharacterized protein CLUP02_02835 [Colletotrichum lupini]|uniref:Uncharacterized protein n=1 Tax=Colletotrichum lupini TaxID=145971 RepID=A0A9Q8SHA0_9PEZI|nr:uncharacterized protein CLUP02_02835 [Colletotrichum lupini]UQC77367.1 hypothetical protein CLUP02_02835 [Colletotrichum lupini]
MIQASWLPLSSLEITSRTSAELQLPCRNDQWQYLYSSPLDTQLCSRSFQGFIGTSSTAGNTERQRECSRDSQSAHKPSHKKCNFSKLKSVVAVLPVPFEDGSMWFDNPITTQNVKEAKALVTTEGGSPYLYFNPASPCYWTTDAILSYASRDILHLWTYVYGSTLDTHPSNHGQLQPLSVPTGHQPAKRRRFETHLSKAQKRLKQKQSTRHSATIPGT